MSRYADPDRCPDCRAPLPAHPAPRAVCPACGLPLAGPAAAELFTTLQRADELVASLRAGTAAAPLASCKRRVGKEVGSLLSTPSLRRLTLETKACIRA